MYVLEGEEGNGEGERAGREGREREGGLEESVEQTENSPQKKKDDGMVHT